VFGDDDVDVAQGVDTTSTRSTIVVPSAVTARAITDSPPTDGRRRRRSRVAADAGVTRSPMLMLRHRRGRPGSRWHATKRVAETVAVVIRSPAPAAHAPAAAKRSIGSPPWCGRHRRRSRRGRAGRHRSSAGPSGREPGRNELEDPLADPARSNCSVASWGTSEATSSPIRRSTSSAARCGTGTGSDGIAAPRHIASTVGQC
jgi:hypothetical protein